jgi:integrase
MTPISWEAFTDEFLGLYSPRRRAPATRTKMAQVLAEMRWYLATTADLTPAAINRWVEAQGHRRAITTNGLLSYLRRACRYARARGYLELDPFEADNFRVRGPRRKATRHLSRSEIARLIDGVESDSASWRGGRLHALAVLLAYTGLRAKEALRLKVEDVDFASARLDVVARGRLKTEGSEASIPVPPVCLDVLAKWAPRCGSEWLFPSNNGRGPWVHGSNGLRPTDYLKRAAVAAGLPPTTMLMLRHSLATHARTYFGVGAKSVQQILRHADPRTQDHYIEEDWDNLREAASRIDFRSSPASR